MKASLSLLLIASAGAHAWPIYQLHEWGTFTTVSGSDGKLLPGLEREEEVLPSFVHSHFGLENGGKIDMAEVSRIKREHGSEGFTTPGSKGMDRRPLANVFVKMETPVIYFHSEEKMPFRVNVGVKFNGGTISQWYPARSAGEKLPEPPRPTNPELNPTPFAAWTLDFGRYPELGKHLVAVTKAKEPKPYQGSIEWDVNVLPPADTAKTLLFKPDDDAAWMRTRMPTTNAVVTTGGEQEGFLFYRGIGKFEPGLKTTVDASETLHITNQTHAAIPYLVVFEMTAEGKVRWTETTKPFDPFGTLDFAENTLKEEPEGFPEPLYLAMKSGLAKQGLNDAEAASMVQTWWRSYFGKPGLRVFWVLPRATTDHILPLAATPPPAETVRVIVGRAEVLRPRDEAMWLAQSKLPESSPYGGANTSQLNYLVQTDRFGLAIAERVRVLAAAETSRTSSR